jgi:hypothetical protein
MMVLAACISYAAWVTLDSYFGSPKRSDLEALSGQSAYLFWVTINEPDGNKDPGSICMWLRPMRETEAKLYKFAYSRKLHETGQSFLDAILKNNGAPIEIAFSAEQNQGQQAGNSGGASNGSRSSDGSARGELAYQSEPRVYKLPPVKLPDKMSN